MVVVVKDEWRRRSIFPSTTQRPTRRHRPLVSCASPYIPAQRPARQRPPPRPRRAPCGSQRRSPAARSWAWPRLLCVCLRGDCYVRWVAILSFLHSFIHPSAAPHPPPLCITHPVPPTIHTTPPHAPLMYTRRALAPNSSTTSEAVVLAASQSARELKNHQRAATCRSTHHGTNDDDDDKTRCVKKDIPPASPRDTPHHIKE